MKFKIRRLAENPLIDAAMDECLEGNVNGPSLIRVPDWVPDRLGKYYLYFAHHNGRTIRLAYADALAGPWKVYREGTLSLENTPCRGHIASPDLHIDEENRRLLMYYHGPVPDMRNGQRTFLAPSGDGLCFESQDVDLAPFYLRVFAHDGLYYGIAKDGVIGGLLMRSNGFDRPFEIVRDIYPLMRHAGLRKEGRELTVFLSRIRENPESILVSRIVLDGRPEDWEPSEPELLIEPEEDYEGADLESVESGPGLVMGRVRALRDPAYYREGNREFLLYSIAGEWGIAIAELEERGV